MIFFVAFLASLNLNSYASASLNLTRYASYLLPILKTQKPLKDLFFKRQAPTYGSLMVDGSVTFLIGLYVLIVAIYINECSSFWTDKFRITKHSYTHHDKNCTVDAIVLAVVGLIGNILEIIGQEEAWFYNNKKHYINKKHHMFLILIFQLMICLICCWAYTAIYDSGLIQRLL
jgi:hypothetical protein